MKIWCKAARPQTLPAAFVPVLVGASLAYKDLSINWPVTLVALLCALLIQIGTNFANDYFDFKKGTDTDERIGFERATATGLVNPHQMKMATVLTMSLAFFAGLYLVWHTGWVILVLGILCLLFGILYTGGPYPLGYNGLGDIFVFIFFGFVAVMGTYYVNTHSWSISSFWASVAVGALCTNILVVNNLRDIEQDGPAGKNTLGVLFGEDILRWEYLAMFTLALLIPLYFYLKLSFNPWVFLVYLSLPAGIPLTYQIWTLENKRVLNEKLKQTAQYMVLFGVLFSIAIVLNT